MGLRFHYELVSVGRMIHSLGGRTVRPRPIVPVSLLGPAATIVRRALLDTASDDTIFPASLARQLGLGLSGSPRGTATLATAATVPLLYGNVVIRLTDGFEFREWPAIVGFASSQVVYPTLGFAGCLQYFWANFMGDREEVELTVNSLYPGT